MAKFLPFLLAIVLASLTSLAQEHAVSGKVTDKKGEALQQIVVTLLQANDSSSAGFEMTDEKGVFTFSAVKPGSYIIAIQSISYVPLTYPLTVTADVPALSLVLSETTTKLSEVTVTDKRPYIESGLGKTILNVSVSTASAGSTVLDLLRKAPGVQVQGSSITLQGAGVLVLVDDKQTYLSGPELADYLQTLSGDQVAQIELITQPSSRYDAEGTGGIINIKTRGVKKKGINGNVSLAVAQNLYPNTHNSLNGSYQNDKLTVYANAGQLLATGSLKRTEEQKVKDQQTNAVLNKSGMQSNQEETFADYSLKLGADYKLTKKTTAGGSVKGIYHPNREHDEVYTNITAQSGSFTRNQTMSDYGFLRNHYICNGYVRYTPGKDQTLTIDGDYLVRDQDNNLTLVSNNYNAAGQPACNDLSLRNDANSLIKASVLKCDYDAKLVKDWNIEAGIKSSFSSTTNGVYFEILDNGYWTPDTTRTNTFIYRENINAAYLSAKKAVGKKWITQFGLRVENTNATGKQVVRDQQFSRTSTSVFPTAFVNYTINKQHSLELNCGRRINRPAYTMLNPFLLFRSQYNYSQGNPSLAPSYEWFGNLRHNFDNKVFTQVRCGYTSGIVTPVIRFNTGNNSVITSLENYSSGRYAALSVNGRKQFYKWWNGSATVGLNYNAYDDIDKHKAVISATGFYFSMEHELTLNHGWSIDTFYHFATSDLQNLVDHYGPRHWLGLNVVKKVWKENGTVRLSIDDPFNMNRVTSTMNYNGVENRIINKWNTQQIALGFTYKFGGKTEVASQRQNNSEEAGRM